MTRETLTRVLIASALAVLALACGDAVGGMMQDAGTMLADAGDVIRDAGNMMQPDAGAQDTPATCNKSETNGEVTGHWAEFPVTPGQTEVTICGAGDPEAQFAYGRRDVCYRTTAAWFDGTSTGYVYCGLETDAAGWFSKPKSITVHN